MKKIIWEKWVDFDEDDDEEVEEMEEIDNDDQLNMIEIMPLMVRTPLGVFSPLEPMCPSRMFDCWVGHTNFPIGFNEKVILDNIEGIEALKIMSKYRFFIGIGKCFSLTDVRPRIELSFEINKGSTITKIIEEISGHDKWAVAIYDNGKYKVIYPREDGPFETDIDVLRQSGAVNIITSDEF